MEKKKSFRQYTAEHRRANNAKGDFVEEYIKAIYVGRGYKVVRTRRKMKGSYQRELNKAGLRSIRSIQGGEKVYQDLVNIEKKLHSQFKQFSPPDFLLEKENSFFFAEVKSADISEETIRQKETIDLLRKKGYVVGVSSVCFSLNNYMSDEEFKEMKLFFKKEGRKYKRISSAPKPNQALV